MKAKAAGTAYPEAAQAKSKQYPSPAHLLRECLSVSESSGLLGSADAGGGIAGGPSNCSPVVRLGNALIYSATHNLFNYLTVKLSRHGDVMLPRHMLM